MPLKSCETWTSSGYKRHADAFMLYSHHVISRFGNHAAAYLFRLRPARTDKLAGCLLLSVVCCVQTPELAQLERDERRRVHRVGSWQGRAHPASCAH